MVTTLQNVGGLFPKRAHKEAWEQYHLILLIRTHEYRQLHAHAIQPILTFSFVKTVLKLESVLFF
jgi:hypothetical protein